MPFLCCNAEISSVAYKRTFFLTMFLLRKLLFSQKHFKQFMCVGTQCLPLLLLYLLISNLKITYITYNDKRLEAFVSHHLFPHPFSSWSTIPNFKLPNDSISKGFHLQASTCRKTPCLLALLPKRRSRGR